jgi:hypothetical protein
MSTRASESTSDSAMRAIPDNLCRLNKCSTPCCMSRCLVDSMIWLWIVLTQLRLSHNRWGPHDDNFYKLWDELREEWGTLQMKGYTGEGFLSKGKQLGGRRIPVDEMRRQARAAAQQRAKENAKSGGGHVLGGATVRGRDMRQVLADAAAKRSTNLKSSAVNSGCATGTRAGDIAAKDALKNGFRTKAEMDDANDVAIAQALADLMEQEEEIAIEIGSPPPDGLEWSKEGGLQPSRSPGPSSLSGFPKPQPSSSSRPVPYPQPNVFVGQNKPAPRKQPPVNPHGRPISRVVLEAEAHKKNKLSKPPPKPPSRSPSNADYPPQRTSNASSSSSSREQWSCLTCTLTNEPEASQCVVCDTQRPGTWAPPSSSKMNQNFPSAPQSLGWLCRCGTFMENQWWTCSSCGTIKPSS